MDLKTVRDELVAAFEALDFVDKVWSPLPWSSGGSTNDRSIVEQLKQSDGSIEFWSLMVASVQANTNSPNVPSSGAFMRYTVNLVFAKSAGPQWEDGFLETVQKMLDYLTEHMEIISRHGAMFVQRSSPTVTMDMDDKLGFGHVVRIARFTFTLDVGEIVQFVT